MRKSTSVSPAGAREDRWLEDLLRRSSQEVRAPGGFARKVMDAVYRESLSARALPDRTAERRQGSLVESIRAYRPSAARLYRRVGLSFMLTAAVLAASLLVPHGAYSTLIGGGPDAALGAGPSAAVQRTLAGAGHAVQSALGEQLIGGNQ
jgi:hypothetical protein